MKSTITALLTLLTAASTSAQTRPDYTPGPTELTFTERSPLSDLKNLAARFGIPPNARAKLVDYDLAQQHFLVYLPKPGADGKPMGLIVLALYKKAGEPPADIFPELDAGNVALIVSKNYLDSWYDRAGVCLDEAFNMQKTFAIDPRRVYVFGNGDFPDQDEYQTSVATRLGLSFADVFTGTFTGQVFAYHPIRASNGGIYAPTMPHPLAAQFGLAKAHPLVLATDTDSQTLFLANYKSDGFQFTKIIPVNPDQFHYPHFQPGWIPQVLQFLDSVTVHLKLPKPRSTMKPTTIKSTQ